MRRKRGGGGGGGGLWRLRVSGGQRKKKRKKVLDRQGDQGIMGEHTGQVLMPAWRTVDFIQRQQRPIESTVPRRGGGGGIYGFCICIGA